MKQYQCIFLTSILLLSACAKDEQVKAETVPRAPASTSSSSVAAQAAVAATAGLIIGETLTQRKAAYASMEQQLLGELKHTKAMNSRLQQHITKQKMSAAKYDSQINKLTTDEEMAKKDILTLKKLNSEIAKAEQEDIGLLKAVMKEMVFKNETLTSAESLNQQRIKLSKEINLLKISVNNLAANKKQLTQYKLNINSKLANKS